MRDKTPIREQVARRKTPQPQRVKPLTLADLAGGGVERIACVCDWCRHEGTIALAALIAKRGAAAQFRDVARRFRCTVCGWRGVHALPLWPGRKVERPPRPPALPSIDECRKLMAALALPAGAPLIERRAAYINALRQRWPEMTASAAQFVVNTLRPWASANPAAQR